MLIASFCKPNSFNLIGYSEILKICFDKFLNPMPVLAHCERGLILDVFGENPAIFKCEFFKISKNVLILIFKDTIKVLDLKTQEVKKEIAVPAILDAHLSSDGRNMAVQTQSQEALIFKDFELVAKFENIEHCGISNAFYYLGTKESRRIFSFESLELLIEIKVPIKSFYVFNTLVVLITEKEENQKMLIFRNNELKVVLTFENIYRTIIESNEDETKLLFLIATAYTKDSYYANSTLYYLAYSGIDQKTISSLEKDLESKNDEDKSVDFYKPSLKSTSNAFTILEFEKIKKIHSVGFLNNGFYVCFGDQPASLYLFDFNGGLMKKHHKSLRNTVVFNRKENRIVNAGLGNLPGNIEVYNKEDSTCSFELLGSSIVSWLNNDCHFMIAITNYFKSENKIAIYDYYGKLLEEMVCKSLVTACVYGDPENEVEINPPEKIIKKEPVQAYVPPHLQGRSISNEPGKSKVENKKKVSKTPVRTKEMVEKELKECLLLRTRMQNHEELTVEEENRVFKIKSLEEELEKLKN